jgi:hypothetical protein
MAARKAIARNVSAAAIEMRTEVAASSVNTNTHESRSGGIPRILFDLGFALRSKSAAQTKTQRSVMKSL